MFGLVGFFTGASLLSYLRLWEHRNRGLKLQLTIWTS